MQETSRLLTLFPPHTVIRRNNHIIVTMEAGFEFRFTVTTPNAGPKNLSVLIAALESDLRGYQNNRPLALAAPASKEHRSVAEEITAEIEGLRTRRMPGEGK